MGVVCVVIENWSNCEDYEDYAEDNIVLEVCGNPTIAERIILNRRDELIKKAEKYKEIDEDYDPIFTSIGPYAIKFENGSCLSPFDHRSIGTDYFSWSIEDHEIVES